jgi:manganese transport protein
MSDGGTLSARTTAAIDDIVAGRTRAHPLRLLVFAGPAVIASIAYMDPGNFATNIQAGARYGYALLWVVVAANLMAMMAQALSAKLGIVTGRNLAELSRDSFPRPVVLGMWLVSEVAAMATDLAELLGGAIGLSLLLHLPLIVGMLVTALITYGLLLLDRGGYRPTELAIGGFVVLIALCYVLELTIAPIDWGTAMRHSVLPSLPDGAAVTIAVGIIGATVMPHAIYLHSGLTQHRATTDSDAARRRLVAFSNREVVVALGLAGIVNLAMVMTAAAAFHGKHDDVAEIGQAYVTLSPLLGPLAAGVFLVSLLASGLSSSVVGTMAGQMIMAGFLRMRVPILVRRLVTMAPAFLVVAYGIDPTKALVMSQVVLSFALPVPLVALVILMRRRELMGDFVNSRLTHATAVVGTILICLLNVVLILQTLGVAIPGLSAV